MSWRGSAPATRLAPLLLLCCTSCLISSDESLWQRDANHAPDGSGSAADASAPAPDARAAADTLSEQVVTRAGCRDGLDNDGDGRTDYPDDPGCSAAGDADERGTTACDDGQDNDGDGQTDFPADTDCTSPSGANEGCTWRQVSSPTTQDLHSIWGSPTSDIWVTGDRGVVLRYRRPNGPWSLLTDVPKSVAIRHVWGRSDDDVWVVGIEATLLRRRPGGGWEDLSVADGTPQWGQFHAAWGGPSSPLWIVGGGGIIRRYDDALETVSSPTDEVFSDVWGSGDTPIWAVGLGHLIVRYRQQDDLWSLDQSAGKVGDLYAVHGQAPDDVWAVGVREGSGQQTHPLTLHHDGRGWTNVLQDRAGGLEGVWTHSSNKAWAVGSANPGGNGALALQYDGARWAAMATPAKSARLSAVWAGSACDVWAVGAQGTILHLGP